MNTINTMKSFKQVVVLGLLALATTALVADLHAVELKGPLEVVYKVYAPATLHAVDYTPLRISYLAEINLVNNTKEPARDGFAVLAVAPRKGAVFGQKAYLG